MAEDEGNAHGHGQESQTQAAMPNYYCIQLLPPAILTLTVLSFINSLEKPKKPNPQTNRPKPSFAIGCSNTISVTAVTSLIAVQLHHPCLATSTCSGLGDEKNEPNPTPNPTIVCDYCFFVLFLLFVFCF